MYFYLLLYNLYFLLITSQKQKEAMIYIDLRSHYISLTCTFSNAMWEFMMSLF